MSFLAGMFTSGLAACYAIVSLSVWGIVARIASEPLANERWLNALLTAILHGLAFTGIIGLARAAFPRLKESELGGNLFLVAAPVYGVLLIFTFPVKP